MTKKQKAAKIANNALYLGDQGKYDTALWEILRLLRPEDFTDDELPTLRYEDPYGRS